MTGIWIDWKFIDMILREIGITGSLLRLIMHYVTSVSYQAIVNESLHCLFDLNAA